MRALVFCIALPLLAQQALPVIGSTGSGSGGGGGSITLVQSRGDSSHGACNNGGSPSTTLTCAFSTTPTSGNAIVAVCYTYNTNCTISDNASTDTYSQATMPAGSGTGTVNSGCREAADTHKVVCVWYVLNLAGSATLKATVGASSYIIIHQYEFHGLKTSSALDQTGSNSLDTSQTGSTVTTGSATAQANELLFNPCAVQNTITSFTAGSGYTLGMNDVNVITNVIAGGEQYSLSNSAASQTATMTFGITAPGGFTCGIATFEHL